MIIVNFGNYHEICKPFGRPDNIHKWTMVVSLQKLSGIKLPNNKFIEKVRYGLDEDGSFGTLYKDVRVSLKTGDFEMTFIGWGTFDVPITIFWRKEAGLVFGQKTTQFMHHLCF